MVQASDPRTLNSTKFGQYVRTSDLQMSDGYKCRTGTNVGPVQMSTGTFIRKNIGLWLSLKKKDDCYKK